MMNSAATTDDDDDDDDEDEDENAIATALMMRGAGSVGQLGREFWSQQWHWSSGFVHRIHSQCHHSNHDHHYFLS